MNEYRWVRLTPCDNIPPREGREVVVGDRHIAVFNLGAGFFATDNRCPHKGGPLCDGIVTGAAVVCPLHAWKVNLATGAVERPEAMNACLQTYPVRVESGVILLGLELERRERRDGFNAEQAEHAEIDLEKTSAYSAASAFEPSQRPLPGSAPSRTEAA